MNRVLLFILMLFFISCSNDNEIITSEITNKSDSVERLNFKDFQDFINTYNKVSEFETMDEYKYWILKKQHSSLLEAMEKESIDLELEEKPLKNEYTKYSSAIKAIFNKNSEISIGDDIIVFKNGKFIVKEKDGKMSEKSYGHIEVGNAEVDDKDLNSIDNDFESQERVFSPNQWIKRAKNFYADNGMTCNGFYIHDLRQRKFIHEIMNERIYSGGSTISSKLLLRIRMDAQYCSFWSCNWENQTAEARRVIVNAQIYKPNPGAPGGKQLIQAYNNTFNCVTDHLTVTLIENFGSFEQEDITFGGTINHLHYSNSLNPADTSNYVLAHLLNQYD